MNRTAARRPLIAVAAAVAFILITVIVANYGLRAPSGPEIGTAPAASRAVPSAEREFRFARLPEPRRLPEFRFEDADGRALTIADFRGRLILLNIWATWCGPCRREMPTLERLQIRLGGPEFEVVALSIDRQGAPVVGEFYRELGVETLAVYVDKSAQVTRQLNILGLPTTLLIDREGREIGRVAGPAEWDGPEVVELVRRYLKPRMAGEGLPDRSLGPDPRSERIEP